MGPARHPSRPGTSREDQLSELGPRSAGGPIGERFRDDRNRRRDGRVVHLPSPGPLPLQVEVHRHRTGPGVGSLREGECGAKRLGEVDHGVSADERAAATGGRLSQSGRLFDVQSALLQLRRGSGLAVAVSPRKRAIRKPTAERRTASWRRKEAKSRLCGE